MYEKAKAIVFERPKVVAFKEIPLTPVDDDTIVVQTTMSGISSGTDMKTWLGLQHPGNNVWYPLVPGYEAVGRIVHVGKNVRDLQVGQRVMANECRAYPQQCAAWGGNAAYIIKNRTTGCTGMDAVAKIPDNVSDEEAVVAYLACVAKRGIDKVAVLPEETVLVIGAGNIGLSACQLFRLRGAGRVILMDIHPTRLLLGRKYADEVIDNSRGDGANLLRQMTGGKGADVVFETSGNALVIGELNRYLRDGGWDAGSEGGRIHLQGDYPQAIVIDQYHRWFTKNCSISMSCAFRPGDKPELLKLISEGQFDAKGLYSKVAPVADCAVAYQELHRNRYDLLKILFKW